MVVWPKCRDTTTSGTPAPNRAVAAECLSPWNGMDGKPAARSMSWKVWLTHEPRSGRPTPSTNTRLSVSCHASPTASRAASCSSRCRSKAASAAAGRSMVRRDRLVFGSASAQPAGRPCEGAANGQRPGLLVHVGPCQPEQLAEPQSGGRRHGDERPHRVNLRGEQESPEVVGAEVVASRLEGPARDVRRTGEGGDIAMDEAVAERVAEGTPQDDAGERGGPWRQAGRDHVGRHPLDVGRGQLAELRRVRMRGVEVDPEARLIAAPGRVPDALAGRSSHDARNAPTVVVAGGVSPRSSSTRSLSSCAADVVACASPVTTRRRRLPFGSIHEMAPRQPPRYWKIEPSPFAAAADLAGRLWPSRVSSYTGLPWGASTVRSVGAPFYVRQCTSVADV